MANLETKREQFRKYLEHSGVINALSKALIKLYEEPNKPDDAVRFVRQYMCEACPDDEQFKILKSDLDEANETIETLKRELDGMKSNLEKSPTDIKSLLDDAFKSLQENEECKSLLKKYLNSDILDELCNLVTTYQANIFDCIQSGIANPTASIGIYAADFECYETFASLFAPIIREYHSKQESQEEIKQPPVNWGDASSFEDLDPEGEHIISSRIRCARNLEGYPFFAKMTEKHFEEVLEKVRSALDCMENEHKGKLILLENIDPEVEMELNAEKVMFSNNNSHLESAGAYKFWPLGRAVFYNPSKSFMVWINEEDHLRIISLSKSGNLGEVYQRLISGLTFLEETLKFCRHENYGYLTSCPTNIGTTIRSSVHIKLPKLSQDLATLNEKVNELDLQIRGTSGEHTEVIDGVLDISNKTRFGVSEYEILQKLNNGIVELIKLEKEA